MRRILGKALGAARRLRWAARRRQHENGFYAVRAAFYAGFWRQAAEAVGAEIVELDELYSEVRRGDAWTMIRDGQLALDDHVRVSLARNKALTARLLAPQGFVTAPSVVCQHDSLDRAYRFLASEGAPVVVKPDGLLRSRFMAPEGPGGGRGVTCGIRTRAELRRAVRWAGIFGARVIVEKQFHGESYRLLYLDGRLIDAVRRDAPRVFGDGVSTIEALIRAENGERLAARPPSALSPLRIDLDCRLALERQELGLGSVPRALCAVVVKSACNENAAYDNHIAVDRIHPRLARLGGELARHLGLRLAGVDVMSRDPSAPPSAGASVFTEINAMPALHHHSLVAEPRRCAHIGPLALEAALFRPGQRSLS